MGHIEGLERGGGLEVFEGADFVVAEVEDFEGVETLEVFNF